MADTKKAERVKALIACPKTPFADADQAALEQLTDERLTALEAHYAAQPEPKKAEPAGKTEDKPAPVVATAKPKTEEEYLAEAPESIRTIVLDFKAAQAAKKAALIATLKTAQDAYPEGELAAMSVKDLERLAKIAKVPEAKADFAGRGVPRAAEGEEIVPAPPDLAAALKAAHTTA